MHKYTNAAQYKPNGATPQYDGAARRNIQCVRTQKTLVNKHILLQVVLANCEGCFKPKLLTLPRVLRSFMKQSRQSKLIDSDLCDLFVFEVEHKDLLFSGGVQTVALGHRVDAVRPVPVHVSHLQPLAAHDD